MAGFWYGIDEEVKRNFIEAPAEPGSTGTAEVTFTTPTGGGRVWVCVWSEDGAGNSSHRGSTDFFVYPVQEEVPEATPVAYWNLHRSGTDRVGDSHLTFAGVEGVDYDWVDDRFCLPRRALSLNGSGEAYALTAEPVVTTDESFSVAGWVMLDSVGDESQTAFAQGGTYLPAMSLQVTPEGSWRFAVSDRYSRGAGVAETEPGSVRFGTWNHIARVLDLERGEIRLYVNGELAVTGETGDSPLGSDGPFYIGVAGTARGVTSQPLGGVVNHVGVWSSTLHPDRIRDMGGTGGSSAPGF